jgi:hypothetical protein
MARMDHFECDFATQVGVERSVGDAHGASTELDWRVVFTRDQFILA